MSNIFIGSLGILLLAHAYIAVRVGPRLSGTALLFVIAIQLGSALGMVANIAPVGSPQHLLINLVVILAIEDVIRTWFVTTRVKNGGSLTASSLSFAIAISFIEILDELISFILVSTYVTPEADTTGSLEFYNLFISNTSGPLITILTDITRPVDHYLLCISMYYAWRMRKLLLYSFLVLAHIALDFTVTAIWDRDPLNSYIPILVVSLLFTALLYLVTRWIRATARVFFADDTAEVGRTSKL